MQSLVFGLNAERIKKARRKEITSKEEFKLNKESEEAISKVDALLSSLNVRVSGKQLKPVKEEFNEEIKKIKEKKEEEEEKKKPHLKKYIASPPSILLSVKKFKDISKKIVDSLETYHGS